MKAFFAQARIELLLTMRRGESLLVTIGIPVGLLLFFSKIDLLSLDEPRATALAPGIAAVAVMATAMVSLGIATGFERHYLVLKRLGGTPLGRGRLIMAKILAVLVLESLQTAIIMMSASALGARYTARPFVVLLAVLLGTAAFAGIGLLMAGTLKAELNLAASNASFLALLLLGGAVVPITSLPSAIGSAAKLLPLYPLTQIFRAGMSASSPNFSDWLVLIAWATAAPVLAASAFKWEPKG